MLRALAGMSIAAFLGLQLTGVVGWAMDPRFAIDLKEIRRGKVADGREVRRPAKKTRKAKTANPKQVAPALHLRHPAPVPFDAVTPLKDAWPRLVPGIEPAQPTDLTVVNEKYTLSLDAQRYPVLPGIDGRKIILDTAGTLSALVGSLMTAQDSSIRIIAEDPGNRHRFVGAVLGAAGFYSVEENFSFPLAADPRIKITTDYKIESSPDSLLQREVTLLNLTENGRPLPPVLTEYLQQEGFQLVEPYAVAGAKPDTEQRGTIYRLTGRDAVSVTDSLLQAMDLPVNRNQTVQLFNLEQDGLRLDINADRLFSDRGAHYIVSFFAGDPVSYTLHRLLETRGYRVIVIDRKDDFNKVHKRILGQLDVGQSVGLQTLKVPPGSSYAIQLPGVMLGQRFTRGKQVILTTSDLSPLLRELAQLNGFSVIE